MIFFNREFLTSYSFSKYFSSKNHLKIAQKYIFERDQQESCWKRPGFVSLSLQFHDVKKDDVQ